MKVVLIFRENGFKTPCIWCRAIGIYKHGSNCYFEKEVMREYSFTRPSVETRNRMAVLLELLGVTLEELVKYRKRGKFAQNNLKKFKLLEM